MPTIDTSVSELAATFLVHGRWFAVGAVVLLLVFFHRGRLRGRWAPFAWEVGVIVTAYWVYFLVRGLTQGERRLAIANGEEVVDFERQLGLFWEKGIQDLVIHSDWAIAVANWVYILGFWPIIVSTGAWLLVRNPARYRRFRNAFFISGGIGVVIFALYPVAPPRMLDLGLVDTVFRESGAAYEVLQPKDLTNQYAAIPSFHFGWLVLVGIAIHQETKAWQVRYLGFIAAAAMLVTILVTANHYIVDPIVGVLVSLVGLGLATYPPREIYHMMRPPRPEPGEPRPASVHDDFGR
jgi:hypothetical protein